MNTAGIKIKYFILGKSPHPPLLNDSSEIPALTIGHHDTKLQSSNSKQAGISEIDQPVYSCE